MIAFRDSSFMTPDVQSDHAGDTSDLLMQYRSYLHLLASVQIDRKFRGKIDPSDLVQETMLQAHQKFAQFRGTTGQELMAWLRQVLATQLALQIRRFSTLMRDVSLEQELRTQLDQSSDTLTRQFAASTPTPSENAVQRETAVVVADAIAKLPSQYREVIMLRNFDHMNFDQIAQQLGRSTDATKKLWVRAVQCLRSGLV
jgi:RNA polymerase sigma-70 factor (ECF subfamily)